MAASLSPAFVDFFNLAKNKTKQHLRKEIKSAVEQLFGLVLNEVSASLSSEVADDLAASLLQDVPINLFGNSFLVTLVTVTSILDSF